jgi:hypothetical protein
MATPDGAPAWMLKSEPQRLWRRHLVTQVTTTPQPEGSHTECASRREVV